MYLTMILLLFLNIKWYLCNLTDYLFRYLEDKQTKMIKEKDNRDSLDYGEMRVPKLFRKLFWPTLFGMIASVLLNLADGIFVGQGVGSDALAAINVAAPVFLITTGVSLMFGSGVSIVAAVHMSKGNIKAANINITQALTVGALVMAFILLCINMFPGITCRLFGGSDKLYPLVRDYLLYVAPCMFFMVILMVGMFVIRLDGSPKYGMVCNILGAVLNIILDYVFVFPLHMGIKGAASATSISSGVGALMIIFYLLFRSNHLKLYRPKFTRTALELTKRNCGYMIKLGFSTFIAETAIGCMMIVGNFMFMSRLHEDGVAAFSVACYLTPLIFMFGNAISQSAMPIISYNYGRGNISRIHQTLRISVIFAVVCGLIMSLTGFFGAHMIADLFIKASSPAHAICAAGLPLFSICCLFYTINLVLIGYEQSLENYKTATWFMILRGYMLIIPCFILLPLIMGNVGLWLAFPISELITFLIFGVYMIYSNLRKA